MKRLPAAVLYSIVLSLVVSVNLPAADAGDGDSNSETVATVGGQPVTMAELEASVQSQLDQLEQQRERLLESALAPLVERRLAEVEAAAREMTVDELLAAEVSDKIAEVSEVDVDGWFEENKGRLGAGAEKEQFTEQITAFLERERGQRMFADYMKTLRAKHQTVLLLEPFRVAVDTSGATWKGSDDATVTLVEFSDFECPACRGFNPVLNQLLANYPDDLKVAFLQNPLNSIHPNAQGAAEASLCARESGKFWELHDAMFANQSNLALAALKATARDVGLEGDSFDACLDAKKYEATVQSDLAQAAKVGVTGTPSIFINGRQVSPGRVPSLEMMAAIVDDEILRSAPSGE